MDKLNFELVDRIGKALNIKFELWQVNYLLDIPMVLDMRITGRRTGKTLVYIIKLLFADEKPIKLYDIDKLADISDWWSIEPYLKAYKDNHYTQWFRGYLYDIYRCLNSIGISTRPVLYNKLEEGIL